MMIPAFEQKWTGNPFLESSNVSDCKITIEVLSDKEIFNPTGTIIRIRKLSLKLGQSKS